MVNYDWPFGPMDFFYQIWTQWTLRHIVGPDLWSHSHLRMVGWMEICDILLKPPQPFTGLFFTFGIGKGTEDDDGSTNLDGVGCGGNPIEN